MRGPVWFAKYRLPDGRQVQKRIGPAWTERGRPPAGYFTKRTAEDWLRRVLDEAPQLRGHADTPAQIVLLREAEMGLLVPRPDRRDHCVADDADNAGPAAARRRWARVAKGQSPAATIQ